MWGLAHGSAASTCVFQGRLSLACRRGLTRGCAVLTRVCGVHSHPCRHPAAMCMGPAVCRSVQACADVHGGHPGAPRCAELPHACAGARTHGDTLTGMHTWGHTHRHTCQSRGCRDRQGRGQEQDMALGGTRAGWEDDAGPRPRAVRGVSDVPGTGVPPAPAPAAAPPRDPLPTPGPPYGPGPNSSQMGWGGVAFQSLRLEQTPLPPRWAVTRPRPLTPARRPWRGPSCPLPRAAGDPLARGPRWVAPCWNPCRSRGPSRVDRRRTGGHAR